jgi:Ni/Fe-hydrogenase subunit HybB-like protein
MSIFSNQSNNNWVQTKDSFVVFSADKKLLMENVCHLFIYLNKKDLVLRVYEKRTRTHLSFHFVIELYGN